MLKDILSAHFAAYPEMEPQDAVKLIYQNEFGPGHLLGKGDKSLQRLKAEMESLEMGKKEPMYEAIGNGLCGPAWKRESRRRIFTPYFLKPPGAPRAI